MTSGLEKIVTVKGKFSFCNKICRLKLKLQFLNTRCLFYMHALLVLIPTKERLFCLP